jgi:hypothetical protein
MWVHGCGLFRISTEPEFSEFIVRRFGSSICFLRHEIASTKKAEEYARRS